MGNTSSADLAAWVASIVAALSWWTREKVKAKNNQSEPSGGGPQDNVAAEYRAQQEVSRLKLARLLQRREENMVGCIEELERELLISCQMAERDERLRGRLIALQGFRVVQKDDQRIAQEHDHPAAERVESHGDGYDVLAPAPKGVAVGLGRGQDAQRRDASLSRIDMPQSAMVDGDGRVSDAPNMRKNVWVQPESRR